ncbi:MAG: phospholipase D-like domain-containing protein, partial [Chloroflexota bacterium]
GVHRVQPLLTLPAFRFALSPLLPRLRVAGLPAAPQGRFEVREGLKKAILSAERYIYIEDQYLWSLEVMRWINQALRRRPALRVILATGESDQIGERLSQYRSLALLEGLLPGLPPEARRRLGVYRRADLVHTKTTLIDDRWTLIGSSNIARRGLYTDLEHNIAVMDPAGRLLPAYRARLWANRMGLPTERQPDLLDLDCALGLWREHWGSDCLPPLPERLFERIDQPPPLRPRIDLEWYEMMEDPDSRRPWYFPLRRAYPRYH